MQVDREQAEEPHKKRMMPTRLGRLIDDASYATISCVFLLVILLAALYIYLASNYWPGNGIVATTTTIPPTTIDFADALYFCVITFTSTGYGDYAPQGFARVVASFVVLFGLAMATILIGKTASERQNATLLLLYTSDCQRRLTEFCGQLANATARLNIAHACKNRSELRSASKQVTNLMEVVNKYALFNANQGTLASFGNDSTLSALYETYHAVQKVYRDIFLEWHAEKDIAKPAFSIVKRITGYTKILTRLQKSRRETTWPFSRLIPATYFNRAKTYLFIDTAKPDSGRDARTLDAMIQVEEQLKAFATEMNICYQTSERTLPKELLTLLTLSPDMNKLVQQLPHQQRRAAASQSCQNDSHTARLDQFSNFLRKWTWTFERNIRPNGNPAKIVRALAHFERSILALSREVAESQDKFLLLTRDPHMLVLLYALHIKQAQISLERLGNAIAADDKLAAAIVRANLAVCRIADALVADLGRPSFRRLLVYLVHLRANRTAVRDAAILAAWREMPYRTARIIASLPKSAISDGARVA